jgi:hypothetical protein
MEQDMTIQEAEAILMYEDIEPPKQNQVWGAIKWTVGKFFDLVVFMWASFIILFWVVLALLFIVG